MDQTSSSRRDRLPRFCIVFLVIAAVCILFSLMFRVSATFADGFNQFVSQPLRVLFAWITYPLPFSLAEAMLLLTPLVLALLIRHAALHYCHSWRSVGIYLLCLVSVASLFFSSFVLLFAAGYHGTTLDSEGKLDLSREDVSAEELYTTARHLAERVSEEAQNVVFLHEDFSVMPYTHGQMNKKLMEAYDKVSAEYDFIPHFKSRVKPVLLSVPMSYTHITGVYSYFTGEANLNVDFPDYTLPFTAAHELAHQRGIARENEANFIAYLVCISSDDPYIRYSGYLSMYEYVASALYSANSDLYYEARAELDLAVRYEQWAYSQFFDRYRDSVAGEVSGTVNDTYLKLQGTEGTRSYGLVVDLAVAYDKKIYP